MIPINDKKVKVPGDKLCAKKEYTGICVGFDGTFCWIISNKDG